MFPLKLTMANSLLVLDTNLLQLDVASHLALPTDGEKNKGLPM